MSIPLPNLDDRRWVDLVEEGRTLIPFYSPEWTDHNVHDPGITLIELFAWLAEMDVYGLNRIPERHLRKFISLIGIRPQPPRPSLAALTPTAKNSPPKSALRIPASLEFEGEDAFGQVTRFRMLNDLNVVPTELKAIQLKDQNGFHDLTSSWQRGETLSIYGEDPQAGAELYLGFSQSLPVGIAASLLFITDDFRAGELLRKALEFEREASAERCRQRDSFLTCDEGTHAVKQRMSARRSEAERHHSARLVWEFLIARDRWRQLPDLHDGGGSGIADDTRAFTLNGRILIKLPQAIAQQQIGQVSSSLHYVRSRLAFGSYDAAPALRYFAINGSFAEQAVPAAILKWTIAASAVVEGDEPRIGRRSRFQLEFNDDGEISNLRFVNDSSAPKFRVLEYRRNSGQLLGLLSIEAVPLGRGDGKPNLQLKLPESPALQYSFRLFTIEQSRWREWSLKDDFAASGRADVHFLLEPTQGVVSFGDGENGRTVPKGTRVIARYDMTRANEGNPQANRITALADTPHNHAMLGDGFADLKALLEHITNPLPTTGGTAAETLSHAIGRAIESVDKTERAVTLADYEALAMKTPGVRLARVSARANLHPSFLCLNAQGMITLIVLPYLPADRPSPSPGLRRMVANYLFPRRVIGTRVEVIGPTYVQVAVQAQVQALRGVNKVDLQRRIVAELNRFFHPLTGGPDGTGWPFGRDVFRSEVLQRIDETVGVDNVLSLALILGCGGPQCGNLCLSANELVAAGEHQIEVV